MLSQFFLVSIQSIKYNVLFYASITINPGPDPASTKSNGRISEYFRIRFVLDITEYC